MASRHILIAATLLLCGASTLLGSSPAHAQGRESMSLLVISTSTTMSPTTTAIGVRRIRQESQIKELEEEIEAYHKYVLIETYIQNNEAHLTAALSIGEGDTLRDLADMIGLPAKDYDTWASHMRTRRVDVLAALTEESTLDQAMALYHIMTAPSVASLDTTTLSQGGSTP